MSKKITISREELEKVISKLATLKSVVEAEVTSIDVVPLEKSNVHRMMNESRKAMGVTQESVSDLSGVALSTVQKIEKGELNINLQSFQKVLEVLGIELCLRKK